MDSLINIRKSNNQYMKPTKSETREQKVKRLLSQNKIKITTESNNYINFICIGDSDTYDVKYDKRKRRWLCLCRGELYVGKNYDLCTHADACRIYYSIVTDSDLDKNTAYPDL